MFCGFVLLANQVKEQTKRPLFEWLGNGGFPPYGCFVCTQALHFPHGTRQQLKVLLSAVTPMLIFRRLYYAKKKEQFNRAC